MRVLNPVENPGTGPRQIVVALHAMLARLPSNREEWKQRAVAISNATRVLSSFGLDAEALIRYGMPSRVTLPIFLAVIAREDTVDFPGLARWRKILHISRRDVRLESATDDEMREMVQAIGNATQKLTVWAQNAPFDQILALTPPTDAQFDKYLLATPLSDETESAYVWLWQRSVAGHLDRWATTSLHLEYLWQNGRQVSHFPEEVLAADGPDSVMLNAAIALRAVTPREHQSEDDDRLFWQLQDQAVDFLGKGKFTEAAALFEFHHRLHPDDARSINNLGFCRLPLEPESALHHFKKAEAAGYSPTAMNVYNQCCCLYSLNRSGEALDRAEAYWQRERDPEGGGGFIWAKNDGGWTLCPDVNPEQALAELAVSISQELGLSARLEKWNIRLNEIVEASSSISI